jgi:hypothetical protein
LQTARTSAFPDSYDISPTGYYYPDAWYGGNQGFNTDQTGGYVAFTPEAVDIWATNPDINLSSTNSTLSTNAIFDLYDTAGGTPSSGNAAPNAIVLENVDASRRDVAQGSLFEYELPIRIQNGRGVGTPITFSSSNQFSQSNCGLYAWSYSKSDWSSYKINATSSVELTKFGYGYRQTLTDLIAPQFDDFDTLKVIQSDGTAVDATISDSNYLVYHWIVTYKQGEPAQSDIVRHYYTTQNTVTISELDFGNGSTWKNGTPTYQGNKLNVILELLNPTNHPITGTPPYCWYSDTKKTLAQMNGMILFLER